jgi:hypothetical protein
VEQQPTAEVLPGLYRAVLDAIGALEAGGRRREAAAIRDDAIRVYSGAWTPRAAYQLKRLRARAARVAASGPRGGRPDVVEAIERRIDLERTTV